MKKLVSILAGIFTCSLGIAQTGPKIQINSNDNSVDYGIVSTNNESTRTIVFTNTGNAPLIISNVLCTPGFTILSKPNTPTLPGKTGQINIKYNMVPGPIRKTITIESNAVNVDSGRIPVKIKGEVLAK